VLFGLPPVVVEGQHLLVGQAAIGGDEAAAGEQFARMELDLGDHSARLRPALRLILEARVSADHSIRGTSGPAPQQQEIRS